MKQWILLLFGLFALATFAHAQVVTVTSYNIDPSPAAPGSNFTLYAYVTNSTGTLADDVTFSLELGSNSDDTSFPFSIEPTDSLTRELGTINPYTTVQVQYVISVDPDALDGDYTIKLHSSSAGEPGGVLPIVVSVLAQKPVLSVIDSSPTSVGIGDTQSISLKIKNTGSSPAVDILVGLREDRTVTTTGVIVERDIVPLGASSQYIPYLGVNDEITVNIPILVNPSATAKPYFVPVTLEFYDEEKTNYSITDYIGLKVTGNPSLGLIVSDVTPLLTPGQPSRVVIDLFNDGLGPAKFVQASVESDFFSIPTNSFFIGTIESDDFDSLILDGTVSPTAMPGDKSFSVSILYKNEFGETTRLTREVPVHIYAASELPDSGDGGFPLWIIAIVLLGVGYWWFKMRKPKKENTGNGK